MRIVDSDARHLTLSTFDDLWTNGAPLEIRIAGEPSCRLQLDPLHEEIALVTDYQVPEPDLATFKNLTFHGLVDGDKELAKLCIRVDGNAGAAYGLIATIADQIQIEKQSLAVAVAEALSLHRDLFSPRSGLSTEKEIGLFGELLFLEFLVQAIGAKAGISTWQGPSAEEHDFTLEAIHVEVKSTIRERRIHSIHGLEQLVPLAGVPLSLLSIQLTRSTPDSGRSLPSLVADVRKLAASNVGVFDKKIGLLGWHANEADLYTTHWALRSSPRAYSVDGDFPAMTSELVSPVVPNFGLLSEVSYKVDVTNLRFDPLPGLLHAFVESSEGETS